MIETPRGMIARRFTHPNGARCTLLFPAGWSNACHYEIHVENWPAEEGGPDGFGDRVTRSTPAEARAAAVERERHALSAGWRPAGEPIAPVRDSYVDARGELFYANGTHVPVKISSVERGPAARENYPESEVQRVRASIRCADPGPHKGPLPQDIRFDFVRNAGYGSWAMRSRCVLWRVIEGGEVRWEKVLVDPSPRQRAGSSFLGSVVEVRYGSKPEVTAEESADEIDVRQLIENHVISPDWPSGWMQQRALLAKDISNDHILRRAHNEIVNRRSAAERARLEQARVREMLERSEASQALQRLSERLYHNNSSAAPSTVPAKTPEQLRNVLTAGALEPKKRKIRITKGKTDA
jgi:hypothetical protein